MQCDPGLDGSPWKRISMWLSAWVLRASVYPHEKQLAAFRVKAFLALSRSRNFAKEKPL